MRKMRKFIVAGVLLLLMTEPVISGPVYGQTYRSEKGAMKINGTKVLGTYKSMPLRSTVSELGYEVEWDNKTKTFELKATHAGTLKKVTIKGKPGVDGIELLKGSCYTTADFYVKNLGFEIVNNDLRVPKTSDKEESETGDTEGYTLTVIVEESIRSDGHSVKTFKTRERAQKSIKEVIAIYTLETKDTYDLYNSGVNKVITSEGVEFLFKECPTGIKISIKLND